MIARIESTRENEIYLHINTIQSLLNSICIHTHGKKQQNELGTKRMIQHSAQRNKYCARGATLTVTGKYQYNMCYQLLF